MARTLGVGMGAMLMAAATGWGGLALFFDGPGNETLRTTLAVLFSLAGSMALGAFLVSRTRRLAAVAFTITFALLLGWWSHIEASNDRDWQLDVAVLPYATIDGELVTVHNIRNLEYRTETDFTPGYYDKTFDLRELDALDMVAVYWMGEAIAHIFMSFVFGDDHLAVSIETRKERSEEYSTIRGFFKQYELIYIVGDERDLLRVRTNHRKNPTEDVYLFRTRTPKESVRGLFLDYIRQINELRTKPAFYNTLTTNCTTTIHAHDRVNPDHLEYSWKILLSGYAPEYLYEHEQLDTSLPFDQLMRRSHINAAAQAANDAPDFSKRIRAGLPMPPPAEQHDDSL